jgi:hypothetical protein
MIRFISLPVAALLLSSSCGDGGSKQENTSSNKDEILVVLVAKSAFGGATTFARNTDGSTCGVRLNGSVTGFDTSGQLTVSDRSGTILGTARIPEGELTKLTLDAYDNSYVSQECTFTIQVPLFERSDDLTLFEFSWSDADVVIEESAEVDSDTVEFTVGP